MRRGEKITSNMDWILFSVYLLLMLMGIATVYSTAYNADHPNLFDFSQKYGKQVVWLFVSLFLGMLVFLIDADIYRKFAPQIYTFTIVLLVIVLFMPAKNGARAWLGIGTLGIQPAEFAKIGTALLLARFISSVNIKQQNIQTVLIANVIILIPMVLTSYVRAIQAQFYPHKKIAKITFPILLYVAITWVIVYLMISPYY